MGKENISMAFFFGSFKLNLQDGKLIIKGNKLSIELEGKNDMQTFLSNHGDSNINKSMEIVASVKFHPQIQASNIPPAVEGPNSRVTSMITSKSLLEPSPSYLRPHQFSDPNAAEGWKKTRGVSKIQSLSLDCF